MSIDRTAELESELTQVKRTANILAHTKWADGIEAAAKIAEQHGSPETAADIRALLGAGPSTEGAIIDGVAFYDAASDPSRQRQRGNDTRP